MYKYILFDLDGTLTDSYSMPWKNAAKAPAPTASCCHLSARR